MKHLMTNRYVKLSVAILGALCGAGLFFFLLLNIFNIVDLIKKILSILSPIITGFILAYLLSPLLKGIENKIVIKAFEKLKKDTSDKKTRKLVRTISSLGTIVVFIMLIYILLHMIIPQLIASVKSLIASMPTYVDNLEKYVMNLYRDNPEMAANIEYYINQASESVETWLSENVLTQANKIVKVLSTQVVNIFSVLWNLVIGLIVSCYILFSKEKFKAQSKMVIYAVFKKEVAERIFYEAEFVNKTFGGFISGKIVDSVIIGLICFIACTFLQMPYTILVSVFVGVTNIIPFVGPLIGAVPSAFLILLVDPKKALYFVILIIILQQVDGNIIGPKILGDSTGLSAFWVIFAITIFGGLFKIVGMFIGVPVFAVIYNVAKRACGRSLRAKKMPLEIDAYKGDKL